MGDLQVWVPILCHGHDDWMIWVSPMFWTPPYSVGKTMPFLPPMTGNGEHTTHKNGDFSGGWCKWHCFTHIKSFYPVIWTPSPPTFLAASLLRGLRVLLKPSQAVGWLSNRDMDCGDFTKHFKWVIIGILWENPVFLWWEIMERRWQIRGLWDWPTTVGTSMGMIGISMRTFTNWDVILRVQLMLLVCISMVISQ